jgi:hypothetical protein
MLLGLKVIIYRLTKMLGIQLILQLDAYKLTWHSATSAFKIIVL